MKTNKLKLQPDRVGSDVGAPVCAHSDADRVPMFDHRTFPLRKVDDPPFPGPVGFHCIKCNAVFRNDHWQVQVRDATDVLWFQQGYFAIGDDLAIVLRPAVENARRWARDHCDDSATLFVTVDAAEFAQATKGDDPMVRLTNKRLRAIEFALNFVLAGDVDESVKSTEDEYGRGVTADDLDTAHDWVCEQLRRREK